MDCNLSTINIRPAYSFQEEYFPIIITIAIMRSMFNLYILPYSYPPLPSFHTNQFNMTNIPGQVTIFWKGESQNEDKIMVEHWKVDIKRLK